MGKRGRKRRKPQARGVRKAPGDKFQLVLDAYLYAMAKDGYADEISEDETTWACIQTYGEYLYTALMDMAWEQGVELDITPEEKDKLLCAGGVILSEDDLGYVQAMWYANPNDCEGDWLAMLIDEDRDSFSPEDERDEYQALMGKEDLYTEVTQGYKGEVSQEDLDEWDGIDDGMSFVQEVIPGFYD